MEQLRTYKKVEPSSLVNGNAGRLMLLPMILLLGNLGLGLYDDSNSNSGPAEASLSASAIVHQRDPMLSLAAGHEQADQELDLLFPELERIMSPLPDELVSHLSPFSLKTFLHFFPSFPFYFYICLFFSSIFFLTSLCLLLVEVDVVCVTPRVLRVPCK